jgi:hypothetical protein
MVSANPSKQQSRKRGRKLADKFRDQMVEKNDAGIKKYGGALQDKNAFAELKKEVIDQANYVMEAEEQINNLVAAAKDILVSTDVFFQAKCRKLEAALAPFLNPKD